MKLQVIITGATGMVGEGVLHECLQNPEVEKVLVLGRRPCNKIHPKLTEIIHADFFNCSSIQDQLKGYNACFFCLGVSSVGMKEPEFFKMTHTLTMEVAGTLSRQNPDMVFSYISGTGTDSTEKGRQMWARVKGKTENDLLKLPFKKVYLFRPGYMQPTPGLENTLRYYRYISWMYPFLRAVFPRFVCRLSDLGKAMIVASTEGYARSVVEVKDIVELAKKAGKVGS